MPKILVAVILAVISQTAAASGFEDTFLVLPSDAGKLSALKYASDGEDERAGIRRYSTDGADGKSNGTRCSYDDSDNPRKLACTVIDGKRANRVFEERTSENSGINFSPARKMYKQFVGERLASSVGELHHEMFVCVTGCPRGRPLVGIWITCAECGMEEWARSRR